MKDIILPEVTGGTAFSSDKTFYPISIASGQATFLIKNEGTAATPCRITFVPMNDAMLTEITGLTESPIKISNVMRGQRVSIDGINKTVEVNGTNAFSRYDGWEFPKLQPGDNTVRITNADDMNLIEVEFQPRYI